VENDSSHLLPGNYPCIQSECNSSDAVRKYDDGQAYCFSCTHFYVAGEYPDTVVPSENKKAVPDFRRDISHELAELDLLPIRGILKRGISEKVARFFGIKCKVNTSGHVVAHYYPYPDGYWKERIVETKKFRLISEKGGNAHKLFGQDKFAGGGQRLVITEGELDAAAVAESSWQKYGKIYPVVSIQSATTIKAVIENREWIRSFDKVILCLDEDDAGEEARSKLTKIIGLDKVYKTKLPGKDANEILNEHGTDVLISCIFGAEKIIPGGIIGKEDLWEALVKYNDTESHPYPSCLDGLNEKLKGIRDGEIALFISGTSAGKSTMLREVMLDILSTTDQKIGIISLEESPAETARKLAGMAIMRNPAKEEIPLDELKVGFDKVFDTDRVIVLDHQGSISDESILDKLEYMCLSGAKKLFIDHITMLTSEGINDLQGNEAQDKIMNELLKVTKRHNVWIGLVSHLRKSPFGTKSFEEGRMPTLDDIKGSGSIKQVSFDVVGFARNMTASNDTEKNTIRMRVLKSRFTGLTGDVQGAYYNYDTGRLVGLKGPVIKEYTSVEERR
jgi:twinkle protein